MHFLCGHSYNLRTLGDGDPVCPLCAGEHRKAQELRRSNRASAADKDSFFKQLRTAPDGFGLVAEYFGKGGWVVELVDLCEWLLGRSLPSMTGC